MRARWVTVVVVLVAALAHPAAGAQPADVDLALRHTVRPAGDAPALTSVTAAGDLSVRRMAAAFGDGEAGGAQDLQPPSERFLAAGDLDDDGVRDLLALRRGEHVVALRGADGSEAWRRPLSGIFDSAIARPVGVPAAPGVLTLTVQRQPTLTGESVDYTFSALDGSGAPLWSTSVGGAVHELPAGDTIAAQEFPVGLALSDVDGDGATDLRIARVTGPVPGVLGYEASTIVISGADGTAGEPTPAGRVDGYPIVDAMPDLDGDGRDELALLGLTRDRSTATALDGRTGETLWFADDLEQYSLYVVDEHWVIVFEPVFAALGDVTGDGVGEVRLLHYDRDAGELYATAVDGATGERGFAADVIQPLGDISGDGRPEISTVSASRDAGVVTYRYDAVDLGGAVRRSTTRTLDVGDRELSYAWLESIGDADADGVAELEHDVVFGTGADRVRDSVLLGGRTMTALWEPATGWFHATFDGRGVDHLTMATGATPSITARDGATGAVLWSQAVTAAPTPLELAVDRDGDGRHELLVDGACVAECPSTGRPVTLFAADGAVLWEQRRD